MRSINLVPHLLVLLAACSPAPASQAPQATADVTVFEGALLITGEDGPPIENSAFIVENGRLTLVGRSGEVPVPAGAARVDLSGKTVMPAMVDLHGHIGYRKYLDNRVENFTRENIEDHLQRLAYHGVTAFLSLGTDRRESGYRIRDELRGNPLPDGARYFTGGQGLARPNAGPGIPMRFAAYAISTPEDARLAVREQPPVPRGPRHKAQGERLRRSPVRSGNGALRHLAPGAQGEWRGFEDPGTPLGRGNGDSAEERGNVHPAHREVDGDALILPIRRRMLSGVI